MSLCYTRIAAHAFKQRMRRLNAWTAKLSTLPEKRMSQGEARPASAAPYRDTRLA